MKTNEESNIMFCFAIFLLALSFFITIFSEPATLDSNNATEGMNIIVILNAISITFILRSGDLKVKWDYSFFFIPLYIFLILYAIFSLVIFVLMFAVSAIEID